MIPNQKTVWNNNHAQASDKHQKPNDFALQTLKLLRKGDKLLELGCGNGIDACLFATNGVEAVATDFSDYVIANNQKQFKFENLQFEVLDTAAKYAYDNSSFDCVYACLSLHYFTDEKTRSIFTEIERILKPGGLLVFRCKSIHDPLYGEGEEIEAHMFNRGGMSDIFSVLIMRAAYWRVFPS
jgi:ubiquinone/menaquinone biosynthesis C-methylase UbiE